MKYENITQKIIKSAINVHMKLGSGFLEKVYENAMKIECKKYLSDVKDQYPLNVHYDGVVVGEYIADLIIEDKVIVELKAVKKIDGIHLAQILNYMKATDITVGLLLNFGSSSSLEIKRVVI